GSMAVRNGSAEWRGDLPSGSGTLAVGDGVFEGQYSFASRFEEGSGTNPEQLVAAAHAACFSMALANILSEAGHAPDSVKTSGLGYRRGVAGGDDAVRRRIDRCRQAPAGLSLARLQGCAQGPEDAAAAAADADHTRRERQEPSAARRRRGHRAHRVDRGGWL